jgi:release factor glutamine methyltransferase
MNKSDYLSIPDFEILKEKYSSNLNEVLQKIDEGYPVQYLIGNVEFLNTIIDVDERVLIPRFETENLVAKTIDYANKLFSKKLKIIDLGTGSGCIAICLAKNLDATVTAIDISSNALELARLNAQKNNVDIKFVCQDIVTSLKEKYDIIISNPPYIKENGFVSDSVKKYEPNIALYAKDDGIYYYKKILENHLSNLNKPGLIAFEIGDDEEGILKDYLKKYPSIKYQFESDLAGLTRYLFIFNE